MYKNVASQKWIVFAFQDEGGTNPGEPVTGDAAQITANVRIDGGAQNAVDDTNPTELEGGYYVFDLSQAETNGDLIVICPSSSTANVNVIGVPGAVYTTQVTATRAGYLDQLDFNLQEAIDAVPTAAEIQAEMEEDGASYLDNLNDRLTATRAGYLDQLDFALQEAIDAVPTVAEIQAEMEENGASVLDTIRDAIENGTYGLSALEALVDDLETRLGTPSNLGSGATAAANLADIAGSGFSTTTDGLAALRDYMLEKVVLKNQSMSHFDVFMVDSTDHRTGKTGLTVSGQRSIDGGAFEAVGGSIAEIGYGHYDFGPLAADTNGDMIIWRFTASGADATSITIFTTAG